jgi:hypothetical protein
MDTCTPTTSTGGAAAEAAAAVAAAGSDDGGGPDAMQQDTPRPQGLPDTAAAAAAAAGCHPSDTGDGHAAPMDGISGSGARQQLSAGGTPVLEYTLKFETQMYRLRDDEYSFDIQVCVDTVVAFQLVWVCLVGGCLAAQTCIHARDRQARCQDA